MKPIFKLQLSFTPNFRYRIQIFIEIVFRLNCLLILLCYLSLRVRNYNPIPIFFFSQIDIHN